MFRKLCIVILSLVFICACSTTKPADKVENISEITYEIVEAAPQQEEIASKPEPVIAEEPPKPAVKEESAAVAKTTIDAAMTIDKPAEAVKKEVVASIPAVAEEETFQKTEAPAVASVPVAVAVEAPSPDVFEIANADNQATIKNINLGEDVITGDALSDVALELMGCFIVIIVLFTVSVAIRSANKIMLPKGIALLITLLFTGLPMLISYMVISHSKYWLTYLILLFTYFIFRAKDRPNHFE